MTWIDFYKIVLLKQISPTWTCLVYCISNFYWNRPQHYKICKGHRRSSLFCVIRLLFHFMLYLIRKSIYKINKNLIVIRTKHKRLKQKGVLTLFGSMKINEFLKIFFHGRKVFVAVYKIYWNKNSTIFHWAFNVMWILQTD